MVASGVGLIAFRALGPGTLGAWVALFYALGNVIVPVLAKTAFGQTLDSYLYSPRSSYLALVITSTALLAALLIVRSVNLGRPLFGPVQDTGLLRFISWSCLLLGIAADVANRMFQDPGGTGFGGLTIFRDLLLMAVIARTAALLKDSEGKKSIDGTLLVVVAVAVAAGLVDNTKTLAALPVVSYFATVITYQKSVFRRQLVVVLLGALIFVILVAPLIHALRALGQQQVGLAERVDYVREEGIALWTQPQALERLDQLAVGQFQRGYYEYFGPNGTGQTILGRYASVQQIDPVIHEVESRGPVGGEAIWPALLRLVPSFVAPTKPQYPEAYYTLVEYGLINPAGGKYPTLPLAGQASAAYGLVGLVTIPLATFLMVLLGIKKWGWQLDRNVYATFVLCQFVVVFVNQGDFGQYMG